MESIDEAEGDTAVLLTVGREDLPGGIQVFKVSRGRLALLGLSRASIISRPFWPMRNRSGRLVLQHTDANTVRWLMYLLHSNFSRLPQKLSLDEIIRLGDAVDRFQAGTIVLPYIDKWLTPHRDRVRTRGYEKYEQWLTVASQFGLEDEYITLASHLVYHCRTNAQDQLLAPVTNHIIEGMFPARALIVIADRRRKLITDIITVVHDLLKGMLRTDHCRLHGASDAYRTHCTARQKLCMERYLETNELMSPVQTASQSRMSVEEVTKHVLSSTIVDASLLYQDHESGLGARSLLTSLRFDHAHENCGIKDTLQSRINQLIENKPIDADRKTMKEIRDRAALYQRRLSTAYDLAQVPQN